LPIIAEITTTAGKPGVAPAWSAVALAVAAGCIGLDRYFGFSSGWMRFMAAEQRLIRQRQEFEFSWNEKLATVSDQLTELDVSALLDLAHENARSIQDIIGAETGDWVTDFRGALTDADRGLQPKGQA
jgi:hypothetical protein